MPAALNMRFGNHHHATWILICLALLMPTGTARAELPTLSSAQTLEDGIQFFEVVLTGDAPGKNMRLWVYLPPGDHPAKSLPCVLIAAAGTPLITGQSLSMGDRPEHLPYAKAGFAVIAYELDGTWAVHSNSALLIAVNQFMAAHGGIDNARTAADYALARVPGIDPDRLYTAGHSSAATVALDVAATDPRIKACCAYAPCPDLHKRTQAAWLIASLSLKLPEFAAFVDLRRRPRSILTRSRPSQSCCSLPRMTKMSRPNLSVISPPIFSTQEDRKSSSSPRTSAAITNR